MFKIRVNQSLLVKNAASQKVFDIVWENACDWMHFTHLHRKSVLEYKLLFKRHQREIFLYKARRFYPFPFYDTYVVFREYVPEQHGYRNIYYNIKNGLTHYLNAYVMRKDDTVIQGGEFVFCLPSYWRLMPKLFFLIFKKRMQGIIDEDREMIAERIKLQMADSPTCAPQIPEQYDLFNAFFQEGTLPDAHVSFDDFHDSFLVVDPKDPGVS